MIQIKNPLVAVVKTKKKCVLIKEHPSSAKTDHPLKIIPSVIDGNSVQ